MRSPTRAGMRTQFTKAMWDRLLRQLEGPDLTDPQVKHLAAGIALFRGNLAVKEPRDRGRASK